MWGLLNYNSGSCSEGALRINIQTRQKFRRRWRWRIFEQGVSLEPTIGQVVFLQCSCFLEDKNICRNVGSRDTLCSNILLAGANDWTSGLVSFNAFASLKARTLVETLDPETPSVLISFKVSIWVSATRPSQACTATVPKPTTTPTCIPKRHDLALPTKRYAYASSETDERDNALFETRLSLHYDYVRTG